jgi:hypothetical protein
MMLRLLKSFKVRPAFLLTFLTATLLLPLTGCDDSSDDFDHDPPAGMGTLYVVNRTLDDSRVFIDGERVSDVDGSDHEWFDLTPRTHRVVVTQGNTDRVFRDDMDVLDGQRTILELSVDPINPNRFDTFIDFD